MAIPSSELAALGTAPIRPDKPGGDSVAYDPEFEAIKAEIAKIDSLKGETPNWDSMTQAALSILSGKAKDLTVASYLILSLFRKEGYAGMAAGLSFYKNLLVNFWDTMYPEPNRIRGRVGAIAWLNERLSAAMSRKGASSSEAEAVKACTETFSQVVQIVDEKFGSEAPSLGDLRRGLEEASRASAPAPAAAASSAPSQTLVIDSPDAALKALRSMGGDVRRIVEFFIKADPASPIPYLLSRGVAWAQIKDLPPDRDGVTQFPAPDPTIAQNWDRMVEAGQWAALLQDSEWRVLITPLWLDINYYVGLALENLGHDEARQSMADQCVAFVRRLPRLLALQYQDGRPFASDGTRGWLNSELRAQSGGGQGAEAEPQADAFVEGSRQARSLAARGKLVEAVKFIQDRLDGAAPPRERFRWRLLLAGICLDAGQPALAGVQLNSLDQEIESHGLDQWEPELSLEVLQALYRCEKKLSQNGHRDSREAMQRLDRLFERMCRIDVVAALSLEGKK